MKNDLISVVVPVFNIADYLDRAIKSIQEQTYQNLEIILVDNGSTDGSTELVDRLAETDARIIPMHVESRGVSFARLRGVEAASGEWIGFVDGDDYIEPDMYERLLSNALKYHADISHCGYQMVFPSRVDYYYNTGRLVQQDNITGLKELISGSFIEPGLWNKLFRKTLFHSLLQPGAFDFGIKINEDLLMNYYLFKESSLSAYEDFCPYHYMVRKNSTATSSINESKLNDPLKVRKIIYEDTSSVEIKHMADVGILYRLIDLATINTQGVPFVKQYMKSAREELRQSVKRYLTGSFTFKQRFSALWVALWPASYRWIHFIHSKLNGNDKKYEVS